MNENGKAYHGLGPALSSPIASAATEGTVVTTDWT